MLHTLFLHTCWWTVGGHNKFMLFTFVPQATCMTNHYGQGIPLQNLHHQEINFPITNHQEIKYPITNHQEINILITNHQEITS